MARAPYFGLTTSPETVTLKFRFQINGTSDPDACLPAFQGVSDVTRNAAGVFDVTFTEKYPTYIGHTGSVMGDSGATLGLIVQGSDPADYSSTTGVLRVRTVDTYTDATPAPADPVDNDWVFLEVTFCRRSNLCPSGSI